MKSRLTFTIIFLLILAQSLQSFGQATISGNVSSIYDDLPVQYVTVKLTGQHTYSAETDSLGNYFLNVEAGNYIVMFCYLGWDTITVDKVIQSPFILDTLITRTPYPVSYITAELLPDGKNCLVDWGQPSGPYELIYDDGTVDYYEIWEQAGGGYAIRVTPEVTPYTILGGRVFVGDGSYPPGGNFIGSQIKVGIIDADGAYGLPGTLIDTATIVVDNFGWVDFYGVFDTYFEDESFYLAIWQLGEQNESAPIGVDLSTNSGGLSYVLSPTSQSWNNFSHNLMIRAYVDGFDPGSYSTHRKTGGFINYVFARVTNFDPCTGPASGTITPLALPAYIPVTINLSGQPPGTIAWAVKVVYDANESDWSYSNMVTHGSSTVEFKISLCNDILHDSAIITMVNHDTCIQAYYNITAAENGYAKQENMVTGYYNLKVWGINQLSFIEDSLYIIGDTVINIDLIPGLNPPKALTGREIWKEGISAVRLTWQAPDNHFSIKEWINWDDGFNHSALAADNGFNVAARWTPDQIKEFVGASLSKVKLFIADDVTQLVLKVWTGENASNLIYSEDVTNEISIGGWSELALSDSVILDVSNELWVGYSVSYSYGKFPAGVDKGPAVEGFGNMLSFDGVTWETTNQYGQNYNWNIQVYLEGTGKTQDNLTNLAGFNIYRKESDSDYTYYDFVEYTEDDSMFVFVDAYPSVALDFGYYYKVTSLWNSNIGQCESTPAKSQQNPDEDYVYVFLNDIVDHSSDNTIKVYPNPAYDLVSVFSSDEITSIRIINLSGKVEKNIWVNNNSSINIPLDDLRAGVYIMDIKTTKATSYEKLLIIR